MFYDFDVFYHAAQLLLNGQSPYALHFYNPLWALLPVLPLTDLPLDQARLAWSALTFAGIAWAVWRSSSSPRHSFTST